jgi:crotonobetainyl-CoA:carnitine CoA-transferase CaiB-like acyl-CoA transferase
VVELAGYVSAPYATMMLSDLGADVIKVEPPKGDPFRRFGRMGTPVSPHFLNANRGKRGVVLDLKDAAALAQLHELLAGADVVLSNWRPNVSERLGLSDESLAAKYPRLIRVYVSGFGTSGPLADAPVFDGIVQGHVGSAESTPPVIAPGYVVDKLAASMACQATLAALFDRERNGRAQRVDLALLDAAAYVNFVDTMANRTFVDGGPAVAGNQQAAAVRAVRTSDGWLIVAPVTGDQIRRTCEVLQRPDLADDLLSMKDATAMTRRLFSEIEAAVAHETTDHWVKAFHARDLAAGPCLTIEQHFADPQVVHNHLYEVVDREGIGRYRQVRYPALFSQHGELWPQSGPPTLPPR